MNLSSNIVGKAKFTTRLSYAPYVHFGLGTNRAYGPRPFLEIARNQTLEYLQTGKITRVYKKGSPFKRGRQIAKRNFNL